MPEIDPENWRTGPDAEAVWPPPPVGLDTPPASAPDPAVAALLRRSRTLTLIGCLSMPLVLPSLVLLPLAVRDGLRASAMGGGRQGAGAVAEAVLVAVMGLGVWGLIAFTWFGGV